MSQLQDEDIRIIQLPEAQELVAGMKVAVDSETDGTKSFDLSNLAGKVDEPATAPEAGQVLTFDGTGNTWANPQEGVYVINYSEVTDYSDIDVERAGSQPTFIKIDEPIELTVRGISGTTTVNIQHQLMQLTDYNVNNAWHIFRGRNMASFPGNSPTADRVGSNYNYEVVLQILRSEITATPKLWSVFGEWVDGRNIFNTEPQPYTISYNNGKGANLSGKDGLSTAMQFTASDGTYRKNLLMPFEIQYHDFSTDTTPEQIQFMGWGSTSNRAGYKNLITAQHTYDSTNFPIQTPQVQFLKFNMSSGTPESDQIMNVVQASIKNSDGSDTDTIGGVLVPTLGTEGVLQYWNDADGNHYGWKTVNEVPTSTSSDEGKVLTVDSNGAAAWAASGGGTEKFIIRGLVYPSSASYIDNDKAVVDKTTTEIMAAYESGQELELQFYVINDTTITAADIDSKFAEKKDSLAPCKANLSFAYIPDTSGNIRFGFTFRSSEMYSFESYYYQGMPSAYEYTRTCSQIRIEISRYSSDDSDRISASSYANDLGKWQIQVDYWSDNTTETYGNNWDYFYNTVKYYMKNHNSIDLRLAISGVNTPSYVAHLSDYLLSNNSSYPPLLLFTHLYVPACLQGQAYRTEVRWYKFYPLEEVDPDTGETVKACKLSYGIIETQPMLPNLSVNNSTGFTISSSPWILPENNTYITPTIDSSLTELVILVSDNNTIGFNAGSNPQFTMKFSLSGGRTLRVRVGHQFDNAVIYYFNYDADKGRDLVSPSGVYSTNFVIKVVGTSWTFEKLAEDTNS